MDLISVLILLGIIQGFLLGIVLLTIRRGNRRANRVLGLLMMLYSISILDLFLNASGYYRLLPGLLLIGQPVIFLFGPLFLLYERLATRRDFRLKAGHAWHLLPYLLYAAILMPFYVKEGREKIAIMERYLHETSFVDIAIWIQILSVFIYGFIVYRDLQAHEARVKDEFSSIEKINLAWLRHLLLMLVGVFGVMLVFGILTVTRFEWFTIAYAGKTTALLVSFCIYTVGYYGLRQPEVFVGVEDKDQVVKYERSTLTADKANDYATVLTRTMDEKKPYTNSLLTVQELSRITGIPAYHLSQVLNQKLSQNFFDFVNRYRIEEAKRLLQDPTCAGRTIMSIAYDVGFNSKSVFNTAFRKQTGVTPSEFRRKDVPVGQSA